jgi:Ulp1 family protease
METYLAMSIAKSQESDTMSFVPSHAFYIQFILQNRNIDTAWARQIDLKRLDGIFILLNLNGNHWALGLLNLRTNSFEIYDSLNHGVDIEQNIHKKQFVESVLSYFEALYHFKGEKYEKPILRENIKIPQQNNGYDCGVFTLMYAKNIMEKKSKFEVENFSNIAVDNFRQQIINDIQREQL